MKRWAASCAAGVDEAFGRTLMLEPLAEAGPYYAVELRCVPCIRIATRHATRISLTCRLLVGLVHSPTMLNTQGGPRRNEHAEILRPNGSPIPRLYR